jgi:hypothetical protein
VKRRLCALVLLAALRRPINLLERNPKDDQGAP